MSMTLLQESSPTTEHPDNNFSGSNVVLRGAACYTYSLFSFIHQKTAADSAAVFWFLLLFWGSIIGGSFKRCAAAPRLPFAPVQRVPRPDVRQQSVHSPFPLPEAE